MTEMVIGIELMRTLEACAKDPFARTMLAHEIKQVVLERDHALARVKDLEEQMAEWKTWAAKQIAGER